MATNWDTEIWTWLCANFGIVGGSALSLSFLGNIYLFKKFREHNKTEEWYLNVLKEIEPLLAKIITGDKFTILEKKDAEKLRDIIKSKIRENVR